MSLISFWMGKQGLVVLCKSGRLCVGFQVNAWWPRGVGRAKRYSRALSVIMIDVDHFKKFNDTYGHPKGDEVLRGLAKILKSAVRTSDIVARYGGEEFVILLPETEEAKALILAERIRKDVELTNLTIDKNEPPERVTISLGVSTVDEKVIEYQELIEKADKALYQAKEKGRNRVN